MNRRKDGWTPGRTDGRTDGQTDGLFDGRAGRPTDGRTGGRTDERSDGRTEQIDGQTRGKDGRPRFETAPTQPCDHTHRRWRRTSDHEVLILAFGRHFYIALSKSR